MQYLLCTRQGSLDMNNSHGFDVYSRENYTIFQINSWYPPPSHISMMMNRWHLCTGVGLFVGDALNPPPPWKINALDDEQMNPVHRWVGLLVMQYPILPLMFN